MQLPTRRISKCMFLFSEANSTTYSGYDAALYSAATMYVAQQSTGGAQQKAGGWQGYKKGGAGAKNMRTKAPPKPQQLHYCDVCKIRWVFDRCFYSLQAYKCFFLCIICL